MPYQLARILYFVSLNHNPEPIQLKELDGVAMYPTKAETTIGPDSCLKAIE
jgi:hypothetical protein